LKTRDALERFCTEHRLDRKGYTDTRFRVPLGPITLVFPNPGKLPLHDLHHVMLGAAPSFWGEVEVSALELRAGPPNAIIWILCVGALALAAFVRPRRVLSWWRAARGCRVLYEHPAPFEALLETEVEELRSWMRVRDPRWSAGCTD
jgi:hypothetical protein